MSATAYTADQLDAINAPGSVSVRAGAGSGKTRVLAARYLRALDEGLQPSAIVAITFTEKAAAEMRDRIRRGIDELDVSADTRARLREALIDAPINTIHGFCASILREFPVEAGVDSAFEIADESSAWQLQREAVDQVIAAVASDPSHEARPHLETLLSYYTRSLICVLVRDLMRAKRYFPAETTRAMALPPVELLEAWRDLIRREVRTLLEGLPRDTEVRRLLAVLRQHSRACSDPDDKLLRVILTVLGAFDEIAAARDSDPTRLIALLADAVFRKDNTPRRFGIGSAKAWAPSDVVVVREGVGHLALRLARLGPLRAVAPHDLDECVARIVHALWRVAETADRAYAALKGEGRALDFDDLESHAIRLLDTDGANAVLDTLRARCRLLLVDESQDLNLMQYWLVERLIGGGTIDCFVVGDTEQSIFAFRNADVRLLDQIERDLLGRSAHGARLATNFRSSAPLVAFVNRLFGRLLTGGEDFDVEYEEMRAHRHDEAHTQVELLQVVEGPGDDEESEPPGADTVAAAVARRVVRLIKEDGCRVTQVLDDGSRRDRPATYGDVAVLLRTRRALPELRHAFGALGIPHIVHKGIGFYQTQEVRDIYMSLRFLADPSYDLGLAALLRSPLFALSDDGLFQLAHACADAALLDALLVADNSTALSPEDQEVIKRAHALITGWRELVDRVHPSVLLQRILDGTGAWGTYASIGADGNVRKLVRVVRSVQQPAATLAEVVAILRDRIHGQPREGAEPESPLGDDAAKVMTVHAAKGLEFPIVFVLGLEDNLLQRPRTPTMQIDPDLGVAVQLPKAYRADRRGAIFDVVDDHRRRKELAEAKRLLYVACTRAQDHLFLVCAERPEQSLQSWRQWIVEALDLVEETDIDDTTRAVELDGGSTLRISRETHPAPPGASLPPVASRPHDDAVSNGHPGVEELAVRLGPVPATPSLVEVTVSQLRDFARCPRLYHARHVAGIAFDPPLLALPDELRDAPHEPSQDDAQRVLGLVVHRLLEEHGKASSISLDEAARRAARSETLDEALAAKVAARAVDIVQRFVQSDTAKRVLDASAWRELPFALRINGAVVRGRIDRLIGGSPPLVVDLKMPATPATATATMLDAEYGLQLRLYALAASRLLQSKAARAMIVLPETAQAFEWRYGPAELKQIEADVAPRLDELRDFDLAKRLKTVPACGRCPACQRHDA